MSDPDSLSPAGTGIFVNPVPEFMDTVFAKLGLEADEISQTLLTNRMQRKLQDIENERFVLVFAKTGSRNSEKFSKWPKNRFYKKRH